MMNRRALPVVLLTAVLILGGFALLRSSPDAPRAASEQAAPSTEVSPAEGVEWNLDKAHSEVRFTVTHLAISSVTGFFRDFDATVEMTPDDLSTLTTSATARIASIDTGNDKRDDHLRSDDFFDAETYPEMTFESTGVSDVNGSSFTLNGDLTIKGTTKPVSFETEMVGTAVGPQGNQRAALKAETVINRKDFGLTWDRLTEAGGVIVGEDVTIHLDVQLVRPQS